MYGWLTIDHSRKSTIRNRWGGNFIDLNILNLGRSGDAKFLSLSSQYPVAHPWPINFLLIRDLFCYSAYRNTIQSIPTIRILSESHWPPAWRFTRNSLSYTRWYRQLGLRQYWVGWRYVTGCNKQFFESSLSTHLLSETNFCYTFNINVIYIVEESQHLCMNKILSEILDSSSQYSSAEG